MLPAISVIIPSYNRADCIAQAVKSASEQQSFDGEIIVVDDGSSDNTMDVLQELQNIHSNLKVIQHAANKGVSAARNTGIKAAQGEYIAFLDSDDTWTSDKLVCQYLQLRLGQSAPDDTFCISYYRNINAAGQISIPEIFYDLTAKEEGDIAVTVKNLTPKLLKKES
jgi:glycosyltransferase involved in cell wall biosynthesis